MPPSKKPSAARQQPARRPKNTPAKEMAKYGITRVPVDYYHHGDFRYTNLKDALAQARRTASN